jgi:hypothetical protein
MLRWCFLFLFICAVAAQTYVLCPIDCGVTPDITAEVQFCLANQSTLCNDEVKVVSIEDFESLLGITNVSTVNTTDPDEFVWQPTNVTVPRVSCNGLLPPDATETVGPVVVFICVEVTFCYIDPNSFVSVYLTGTCDPTTIDVPGVGAIAYIGPATFVGPGITIPDNATTNIEFDDITFDGNGTTDALLSECFITSNLTFTNCTFFGFLGPYVVKGEACDYFVVVQFDNVHMHDIPGTPLYFEGLWSFLVTNFLCERCAFTNNSECIHYLITPVSRGEVVIVDVNCFAIADLLPPRCRYCITGDDGFCGSRCNEGVIQVYDRINTEQFANCPIIDFTFIDYFTMLMVTIPEFDPLCRVWSEPLCNFIKVADSKNLTDITGFVGGDIIWDFDAPLICVPGGIIDPNPGPFFLTEFDNALGDPVAIQVLPPLPPAPAFFDPTFELFGTNWTESAPNQVIVTTEVILVGPFGLIVPLPIPPRTGNYVMRCDNDASRDISQTVTAGLANVGVPVNFTFYGARKTGQRFRYAGRVVNLLIDTIQVDQIAETTFSDTMVNDETYYLFNLTWTPPDTSPHVVAVQCDFTGGADAVTFEMDDFAWDGTWAGTTLQDPSVEKHSLSWADDPIGEVILPQNPDAHNDLVDGQSPCVALFGTHVMECGKQGENRRANQNITFPNDGVYAMRFFASRLNPVGNFAGLFIEIIDGTTQLDALPITIERFPTSEDYYEQIQQGMGIVVSGAPLTLNLGIRCDFTLAGSETYMCVDFVDVVAVGVVGISPITTGFSSQTISSAAFITNQTCDCSNFTAPPRNATELPCEYKLNDDAICVETVPYCCFTPFLVEPVLLPFVLTPNATCTDLNTNPPCVFLLDCEVESPPGVVSTCREFTCPFNASNPSLPLASLVNGHDTILADCVENVLTNYTDSLLYPSGVQFGGSGGLTLYVPQPPQGILYFAQPTAYFMNCSQADDTQCAIYTGCDWPPVFDPVNQNFTIYNCDLVNCTNPSGMTPTLQSQLAACPVISSGNTLNMILGGWAFYPVDVAAEFDGSQFIYYLNKLVVDAGNDSSPIEFFTLPQEQADLATSCPEPKYFWNCPCFSNGTYTVPANSSNNDPSQTDDFYTCTSGVASCSCDDAAIQTSNPPPPGTIGLHEVVIPDTVQVYRVQEIRMQQYLYGRIIEQRSYELQARNTIAIPEFPDNRASCRLSIRNDNEFCRGSPAAGGADCYQGNINGPYSDACNIINTAGPGPARPCPVWYGLIAEITSPMQCECLVDDRATDDLPGFGSTIFNTISDALIGCSKDIICVRATTESSYYEENIEITKANKNIFLISLPQEQAIVVGRHIIGTSADNVTIIGFHFIHPADNQQPLFDVPKRDDDSNLNKLMLLNNNLEGSGCRKCGIVDSKRINELTANFSLFTNWQFFTIKLDDVDFFEFGGNTLNTTEGRSLLIKYRRGFRIDRLGMLNVRGGKDLKGAAIISLTAKEESACDGSDIQHTCLLRHAVQHVETTPNFERFRDVCFFISRGSCPPEAIYDNVCRLAQNGMIFLKTEAIGVANLVNPIMMANPLVRPHLFQLPDVNGSPTGKDYVLRSTFSQTSDGGDLLFNYANNVETNYDDPPFQLPFFGELRCQSNINWDERFGFGVVQAPGWAYVPQVPRMGVERFHNASIMVEFCEDRRLVPPLLGGDPMPAFIGRVRPFNGSSLNPEILNVTRDAYLIGDDTDACCKLHRFYPTIEGVAHRLETPRFNHSELRYTLPEAPGPYDMWSSGPLRYNVDEISSQDFSSQTLPNEVCVLDVIYDGLNRLPTIEMWAMNMLVGVEQPPVFFTAKTTQPAAPTSTLVVVRNTTVKNFPSFNSETSPDGFNYLPGFYPSANGLKFVFFNRLTADSRILISNYTVRDVDSTGLNVAYANNISIFNSSFFNCSGRALGNEACAKIYGNDVSQLIVGSKNFNATAYFLNTTSTLYFYNNTGLQTNNVLFPQDDHTNPGWVSHFEFLGFPNTTDYCVLNITTEGLPLGIRHMSMLNLTLLQCSHFVPNPAQTSFPDLSRYLRAECLAGGLWLADGTVHDLAFGPPNTDSKAETRFCDSFFPSIVCCPIVPPDRCYVTKTASLLTPQNPWFGVYVFGSLNDAIVNCNATTRRITVLGTDDPFGTGDTSQKVYTETLSATVPITSTSGETGPLLIDATGGVRWRSVSNRLSTQCVHTTLTNFVFDHPGGGPFPLWDQTAPSDDACGLRLFSNFWNVTVDAWAIRAVVGDHFRFDYNVVRGYTVTRHAVEVKGNGTCSDVGVYIGHNDIKDVTGVGIDVQDLDCFVVNNNKLQNVGGQDSVTFIPYAFRIGVCATVHPPTAPRCVQLHGNTVHTTQVFAALLGLMATCWLDPMPITSKKIEITQNDCRGLEIGVRFDNTPFTETKAQLRAYCQRNVETKGDLLLPIGERFDWVYGPASTDASLVADPHSPANRDRWCTDCCPILNFVFFWMVVAALALCLLFLVCSCLVTKCCVSADYWYPIIFTTYRLRVPSDDNYIRLATTSEGVRTQIGTKIGRDKVRRRKHA